MRVCWRHLEEGGVHPLALGRLDEVRDPGRVVARAVGADGLQGDVRPAGPGAGREVDGRRRAQEVHDEHDGRATATRRRETTVTVTFHAKLIHTPVPRSSGDTPHRTDPGSMLPADARLRFSPR